MEDVITQILKINEELERNTKEMAEISELTKNAAMAGKGDESKNENLASLLDRQRKLTDENLRLIKKQKQLISGGEAK